MKDVLPEDETICPKWDMIEAQIDAAFAKERLDVLTRNRKAKERIDRADRQTLVIERNQAEEEAAIARPTLNALETRKLSLPDFSDEFMRPRWYGNLKQYKFAFDAASNVLSLVDSAGNAAISPVTGYVEPAAVSYWSSPSTFWVNAPRGRANPTSDSPDGEVAEKGGAGQRQREAFATSQAGRNVFTCVGCAPNTDLSLDAAAQFSTGNGAITAGALGVASTERDDLINWVRGTNNAGGWTGEDPHTFFIKAVDDRGAESVIAKAIEI